MQVLSICVTRKELTRFVVLTPDPISFFFNDSYLKNSRSFNEALSLFNNVVIARMEEQCCCCRLGRPISREILSSPSGCYFRGTLIIYIPQKSRLRRNLSLSSAKDAANLLLALNEKGKISQL